MTTKKKPTIKYGKIKRVPPKKSATKKVATTKKKKFGTAKPRAQPHKVKPKKKPAGKTFEEMFKKSGKNRKRFM